MKKCSSCGVGLPDDVSFCTSCGGAAIEVAEEVAESAVVVAAPEAAVAETPTKKKLPKWLILVIAAVVAVGALLIVLLTTHCFGLMDPLDKPLNAAKKTMKADNATIKVSINNDGEKQTYTAKLALNKDKKKVTVLYEDDDETTLIVDGVQYRYRETEDGDYASISEKALNEKDFFKGYNAILEDGEIQWSAIVKEANLGSVIDAKKIDDFMDTFEKEYLNNKKWLKENLGYEKDGNTYVFKPDIEELGESIIDMCDDSKAFKKAAKEMIEEAIEALVEQADELKLRATVSVTVEKGYISKIRIELKGENIDKMDVTVSISDVNKTEISSKDIKKAQEKVQNWIEENSCVKCKEELGDYEFNDKLYCYDCYYTCENCGEWGDYERDGMRVCYDCRYVCDKCEEACGDTYELNDQDVCRDCYYTCDKCGEVSDWSMNEVGDERWCDDCYVCASCGNSNPSYERDGKPVCYNCRYVCDKCEQVCSSVNSVGEEEWCSDCYVCDSCGYIWPLYERDGKPVCYNCRYVCEECGEVCGSVHEEDGKAICSKCYWDW